MLNALASFAPGSRSASSSVIERPGSPSNRFIASITIRPSSGGRSRTVAGTATGRSANTMTSAPFTASDGVVASASPTSASAASVFVLSGSRTPNTTS